ncbi:hypothetical protein HYPSUDRAFT_41337 [Hypholoma sublateritium FD-334 SS-4]|uniref:Uncharacterized protein n=1 Tax=Hypholoma sublateritium (strain FD-334 SS-4) TaxID=945553 RepID=A0A0D2PQQ9_HYPSF|nr:hypothetical protein HYPSUDRAFT_41337 [Hypholoma sublateritium FD-334 SS-4]
MAVTCLIHFGWFQLHLRRSSPSPLLSALGPVLLLDALSNRGLLQDTGTASAQRPSEFRIESRSGWFRIPKMIHGPCLAHIITLMFHDDTFV